MPQLTAGSTVAGRFRLLRLLGRGGHAEVWAAEDGAEARPVALKIAGDEAADAQLLRAGFLQARALVHPGILRPLEFIDGPPACVVMPRVEGGDLGQLRGAGWRSVLAALLDVAEALDHAHRQGIVHRDLKPANVLHEADGRWLISDFGTAAGDRGGTLPAMSPQQLDGAPPAVADDVYALGAMACELLAGEPLFHPAVDAMRIRSEAPRIPMTDLGGAALPAALRALLAATLDKDAARRPASAAALRASLAAILDDAQAALQANDPAAAGGILAVARRATAQAPAAAGPPRRRGLPAAAVYGGLALLLVVAVLVIGFLPDWMRGRQPLVTAAAPPEPAIVSPPAAPAAADATAAPVAVAEVDAALGEFLRLDDDLKKAGADRWGGSDWSALRSQAQAADSAYRDRDLAAALAGYRSATTLGRGLLASAPQRLATALAAGEAALLAGSQAEATAGFTTALALAPDNAAARRGLARAARLDQLLALMSRAQVAESAGQRAQALDLYRQAATLDPAWAPAGAGVARLSQAVARDNYETQMARGLAEQSAGRSAAARAAFTAALQARPGDATAQAALAQLDADSKLAQLAAQQAEARGFAQAERWADAVQRYEAMLGVDPNLVAAREGREQARARLDLDTRLRAAIGNTDHFNDDAVLAAARELLADARATLTATVQPAPVLAGQVAELERLVRVGAIPVPVLLESDNLTEVTIFKVGRLGAFNSRILELRPGTYTAVGARPGYRDVRRSFRVAPGGGQAAVVVRCEDAI